MIIKVNGDLINLDRVLFIQKTEFDIVMFWVNDTESVCEFYRLRVFDGTSHTSVIAQCEFALQQIEAGLKRGDSYVDIDEAAREYIRNIDKQSSPDYLKHIGGETQLQCPSCETQKVTTNGLSYRDHFCGHIGGAYVTPLVCENNHRFEAVVRTQDRSTFLTLRYEPVIDISNL